MKTVLLPEAKRLVDDYIDDISVAVRLLAYNVDKKKGELTVEQINRLADTAMEQIKYYIEKRDEIIAKYQVDEKLVNK